MYGFSSRGTHLWGAGEHFDRVEFLSHPRRNEVEEVFTKPGVPIPIFLSRCSSLMSMLFLYRVTVSLPSSLKGTRMVFSLTLQGAFSPEDSLVIATGTPRETLKKLLSYLGGVALHHHGCSESGQVQTDGRSEQDVREALDAARLYGFPISVLVVEAWSDESTFYTFGEESGLWPNPGNS